MFEQVKAILFKLKGWWSSKSFSQIDPEMDDIVLATSFQETLDGEDCCRD